ncbi:phosphate ABC transporter permease PstA [bacterium]|nr:phosphate ABC transporter permease PstA [bacterium]
MGAVLALAAALVLIPLLSVFAYVVKQGISSVNWNFFTQLPKPVGETGGGMANALLGTIELVLLAMLVGVPWGVATGVYLAEYGRGKFARALGFCVDLMTSVPSIVVGLFTYTILVMPFKRFSAMAGGASLAIIMIPIVARTTEELLKLVPNHIREAGLALGIPRWKVTLWIVLRGSMSGIITGVMLAVARVAGETAPLLFTAFNNSYWSFKLDQPIASLPIQIYNYAISPFEDWHRQAWAGALVLVCFVLVLNLSTRILMRQPRSTR